MSNRTPDAAATPDPAAQARVDEARVGPKPGAPTPEATVIARGDAPTLDPDALMAEVAALSQDDFAAMLGMGSFHMPEAGDQITGTVVRISGESVFIDIGAKSEAVMDRGDAGDGVELGQQLTAYVLDAGERGIRLVRQLSGRAAFEALEQAKESGMPVEGRVESRNPGGFTVRLGDAKAFCPVSQIDRYAGDDLDAYLGRKLMFQITEIRDRDIIVSHRKIAEAQAQQQAQTLWAELAVGDVRDGVVTGSQDFGVFVDIGGVRGLVPKREQSWDSDEAAPNTGAKVQVRVLEVDHERKRITLSLRDPALNPWARIESTVKVGSVIEGTVTRVESFGAFVRVAAGLEGLVHISNLSTDRVEHPSTVVRTGQTVKVRVLGIDKERERLELGLRQAADDWDDKAQRAPRQHKDAGGLGTMADLFSGIKLPKR